MSKNVHKVHGELHPLGGGDVIPLLRPVLTVGRRSSCDIPLRYPEISSMHCELQFRDGYWYVRDLGSTNGIKVNGERVVYKLLHPDDQVSFGRRRAFRIVYQPPASSRALDEETGPDIMGQSLLEKAGLTRRRTQRGSDEEEAADYLLEDEEDEK